MHVCMAKYVHTGLHTCVYTCIHMYLRMTRTYIHTYMHAYKAKIRICQFIHANMPIFFQIGYVEESWRKFNAKQASSRIENLHSKLCGLWTRSIHISSVCDVSVQIHMLITVQTLMHGHMLMYACHVCIHTHTYTFMNIMRRMCHVKYCLGGQQRPLTRAAGCIHTHRWDGGIVEMRASARA
jgi:hypothetical protein